MDWLPELENSCEQSIEPVTSDRSKSVMDCSVDLKLGGLVGSSSKWKESHKVTTPAASPPCPSKRARMPSNGIKIASCLVEGCKSDLSNCRDYHRRHKVCETHSKTPIVLVGGQEQRFCQQCSRFHLLVEFDDVKRSCRKRLDGHNRRRRKPQIDPNINCGIFHPNLQGSRMSSYSHMFLSAVVRDLPTWSSVVKDEASDQCKLPSPLRFINRQQTFPGSHPRSCYTEGKRFPSLLDHDHTGNTISFSASNGNRIFSAGLAPYLDSDCALSLLSSSTSTASNVNTNYMLPADQIPVAQPLSHTHQEYGFGRFSRSESFNSVSPMSFSCSEITGKHVSSVLLSDVSNAAELHCSSIFHVDGTEGSNSAPSSTVIPFPWSS